MSSQTDKSMGSFMVLHSQGDDALGEALGNSLGVHTEGVVLGAGAGWGTVGYFRDPPGQRGPHQAQQQAKRGPWDRPTPPLPPPEPNSRHSSLGLGGRQARGDVSSEGGREGAQTQHFLQSSRQAGKQIERSSVAEATGSTKI